MEALAAVVIPPTRVLRISGYCESKHEFSAALLKVFWGVLQTLYR